MKCDTCGNVPLVEEGLNRINPPPWEEIIVCDHCYDFKAWMYEQAVMRLIALGRRFEAIIW